MPGILGFSFLLGAFSDGKMSLFNVAIPSFSGFLFLQIQLTKKASQQSCCNAQFLGLFISTLEIIHREYNVAVRVAMPGMSGFSFLRYPLKTIVKSIVSSIIFASNSQNILKSLIFLAVLGFLVFMLT